MIHLCVAFACSTHFCYCHTCQGARPSRPMYVKGRVCKKTGFQFHECKRGSPRLEGSFLHTALVRKVTAMNASPEWLDAIVNEHDFCVVVKALRKRDLLPAGRHYDLQLLDMLYDLIPAAQREAILGKWVRTKYDPANPPQLRHGLHFGRESLRRAAAAAEPPAVATPAVGKGKCAQNCRCGAPPSVILLAVHICRAAIDTSCNSEVHTCCGGSANGVLDCARGEVPRCRWDQFQHGVGGHPCNHEQRRGQWQGEVRRGV